MSKDEVLADDSGDRLPRRLGWDEPVIVCFVFADDFCREIAHGNDSY